MLIDLTNGLVPFLYGFLGLTLGSGISIAFAAWHAIHLKQPKRPATVARPAMAPAPRGIFVSPRVMQAATSLAH